MIPNVIYTYWDSLSPPFLVRKCFETFRRHNPHWEIVILNSENAHRYISSVKNYKMLIPSQQADWIRICVISERGGVWIDASIIMLKPVTEWVDMEAPLLQGFSYPHDDAHNILESWAFAAPPNLPVVLEWRRRFRTAIEMGFERHHKEVILKRYGQHPDIRLLDPSLPYLTIHAAYIIAIIENPDLAKTVRMLPSVEGPFEYLKQVKWNSVFAAYNLASKPLDSRSPFFKLRGCERSCVSWLVRLGVYRKGSALQQSLGLPKSRVSSFFIGLFFLCLLVYIILIIK
jgi:hypothetical protein